MDADCVIVGGGPAGMVAGLLFARAGVKTLVLEKHGDFLRDFRGDTVHPSTLAIFHELGLLDALLRRPHDEVTQLGGLVAGQAIRFAEFSGLKAPAPFIAMMPQWEFLDFVADAARRYPAFTLRQNAEAAALIEEGGRVAGVRLAGGEEVLARLTIACDGRHSVLRDRSGLPSKTIGAPMDVFWFRLPKPRGPNRSMGVFDTGLILALIDRGDYWQCAFVFAKGSADRVRGDGLEAFRARIARAAPDLAEATGALASWDEVKLLTVTVDRLERWHRPGLLVIGDAAHAMSPIGGVGINLAVQDAVAAANALAGPMARGEDPDPLLHKVEDRRLWPTRMTQGMQKAAQDRIIAPLLGSSTPLARPPLVARLFDRFAFLRRIPARVIGMGFRPEHVRSPEA
ncbi:FAD-dependent oxidoreductase [Sphingomonas sp. LB-2]|uniref:FAD-dependent oxidoreductase n=1 Tax=Sphingomonas caeni TaxID=2984949 RepID=UPI00223043C6|nr:FAD-dependent oxidoreductase [Sphingomonas caeni]MCW3849117.1 FAD-dependent oxidoreductase [Sphingomonas caeni]